MSKFRFFKNYFPFLFSVIILFIDYLPELINPIFPGDSGFRLLYAKYLILNGGSRVWLPFLQLHIFLLYLLKSPVFLYKLIPIIYYLILLFTLNKLIESLFKKQSGYYREIPEAISVYKNQNHIKSLKIAVVGIDYWKYFIPYLTGSLLYQKIAYVPRHSCLNYDIIISNTDYFADNFYLHKTISIDNNIDINMWFKK